MRFLHLDTLRFILAFYVVFGHTLGWTGPARNAGLAVDFFFILSGFVLTQSLVNRPLSFRDFAIARIARLWPLQVATMAAVLLLAPWPGWEAVLVNLSLMQNSGIVDELTINIPAWSISSELIIGVLLLYPIARYGLRMVALVTIVFCYLLIRDISGHIEHLTSNPVGPVSAGLLRCAIDTSLGYLVYQARPYAKVIPRGVILPVHVFAIIGIFWCLQAPIENPGKTVAVIFSAFAIWALSSGESAIQRVLASKNVAWLGSLSFGIYMWHFPILLLFRDFNLIGYTEDTRAALLAADWNVIRSIVLLYLSIILVAAISYAAIEKPAKRAIIRFSETMKPALAG
ncbi:acyltransferase [Rhizobium sp. AB2/73]|uniref:acyltransferase family protein n=1 Tax=Rhizobium sp. AB2/73 TaxID=2795216 RepID=UPI001C6066FD|nr:acyltransferase [Rhizobium sp. AB2/73]QYA12118.1 acyltransferase [Rhizobium sp. AB2/73]UEQ81951.1 acyltransferase [Rhizobium sp. AB2/73]